MREGHVSVDGAGVHRVDVRNQALELSGFRPWCVRA